MQGYTVVHNGNEYKCVAQDMSAMMEGVVAMGDLSAMGLASTGEPFLIIDMAPMSSANIMTAEYGDTLSIYQDKETVHKLDPKFLPDGVATDIFYATFDENTGKASVTLEELELLRNEGKTVKLKLTGTEALTVDYAHSGDGMIATGFQANGEMPLFVTMTFATDGTATGMKVYTLTATLME